MVDVLGLAVADSARPALRLDLGAGDAITAPQVVFACPPIEPLVRRFALGVVARLAVAAVATRAALVARELSQRLDRLAVGTPSVAIRHVSPRTQDSSL